MNENNEKQKKKEIKNEAKTDQAFKATVSIQVKLNLNSKNKIK